jgi:hypothetical protein
MTKRNFALLSLMGPNDGGVDCWDGTDEVDKLPDTLNGWLQSGQTFGIDWADAAITSSLMFRQNVGWGK